VQNLPRRPATFKKCAKQLAILSRSFGSGRKALYYPVRIGHETETELYIPDRGVTAEVGRRRSAAIFYEHTIVAKEMRVGQRVQHALIGVDAAEE
jgi:hypothetical protein